MTEIMDMHAAASTLFPSMPKEAQSSTPTDNGPAWLDDITKQIKEDRDRAAGIYDKTTKPKEPTQSSSSDTKNTEATVESTRVVENVAKEMGFDPSELPQSLSKFVADNKLDSAKVRGLVEMHNEHLEGMQQKMADEWRQTSELTLGLGDINAAKQVVQKYGDSDIIELLHSPIGNHPALIRFLAKIGKATVNKGRY